MPKLVRAILLGAGIGVLGAGALALPSLLQSAVAEDQVPEVAAIQPLEQLFPKTPGFDMSRLKKFDITFDASVNTAPQSTMTIRKFGFGQRRVVTISKTPTGTYSSDAIASPYVRYPGVHVSPHPQCGCAQWIYLGEMPPAPEEHYTSFLDVPAPKAASAITWL